MEQTHQFYKVLRIYEVSCEDCDQNYIGQTRRSIKAKLKGHMAHFTEQ